MTLIEFLYLAFIFGSIGYLGSCLFRYTKATFSQEVEYGYQILNRIFLSIFIGIIAIMFVLFLLGPII